jgi:type II secretory pathway pseudopilin PulG
VESKCELYADLLVRESLGDITEKEQLFLRRHLEVCVDCRARLSLVTDAVNVMKREGAAEAPAGLAERTLHKVERAGERFTVATSPYREAGLLRPSTWRIRKSLVGWMVAASVLVMAGAALLPEMLGTVDRKVHSCQDNLRMIGTALMQYASDHNGLLPIGPEWYKALNYEYLRRHNALLCPARMAVGRASEATTDYVYNPNRVSTKEPSDYPLLWDKKTAHEMPGRNVLFVDGNIRWLSEDEFQKLLARYRVDENIALN